MTPNDPKQKDIDQHSGIETTGHDWDGIKELNNPAPRWWVWIFLVTIVWAIGYWIMYPAWPTLSGQGERGGTEGLAGWTQYTQLKDQQAEIIARRSQYQERFQNSSFEEILNHQELYAFAIAGGKAAFKDNCATCHGTGGAGAKGYPNLNDDDWLWGGTLEDIYQTISHGIRSQHDDTRDSLMPAFAEILDPEDIDAVAAYVFSLSQGKAETQTPLQQKGLKVYEEQCAACHGDDGRGQQDVGAPDLADSIWLYSNGDIASITSQIKNPKHGMMPNWDERLSRETLRQLTLYVHSLGGGE